MHSDELELLLYEEENATLDFKRDQYQFSKASEEDKSELLKDIVGFANAWRRAEAIILIGVEEVRAGRSLVHGVAEHLDDHSLQQFVNNLLNRPLQFGYEAREIDGKPVGVIKIACQRRPFFLRRDYGKLSKDKVYVRRGSSTSINKPANLDEVASMGNDPMAALGTQPTLELAFADPEQDCRLPSPCPIHSEYLKLPADNEIASFGDPPTVVEVSGKKLRIPALTSIDRQPNATFYRVVGRHQWFQRLFTPVRLEVHNLGTVAASDVVVEIRGDEASPFYLADYEFVPDIPKRRKSMFEQRMPKIPPGGLLRSHDGRIDLEVKDKRVKLEVHCGVIQPGRSIYSDRFYIAVRDKDEFSMQATVYSSSRYEPQEVQLAVSPSVTEETLSLDGLYEIADNFEDEDES